MKRWIHTSTDNVKSGFYMTIGNKGIFLESNKRNLTKKIVRDFINKVCDIKNVGDKIRQSALYDEATLKDFQRRITRANLEHRVTDKVSFYSLYGDGFTENFPEDEFERSVIFDISRE